VSVTIRRGDGIRATYTYGTDVEVVKTGTGAYRLDYTTVVPGQHWFRWLGIGTNAAADEERFIVAPAHTLE
jgi:hypothetical protein